MIQEQAPGQIIILNGTPRSGKSSIVAVIQNTFDGVWVNLRVDRFMQMTPARYLPGIGLSPGGERQRYRAASSLAGSSSLAMRTPGSRCSPPDCLLKQQDVMCNPFDDNTKIDSIAFASNNNLTTFRRIKK